MRSVSWVRPKPLMEFREKPILDQIIRRASRAGIERFTITVGYRSDLIRQWFAQCRLDHISARFVENRDYHKQNGISALRAKDAIDGNFLLLMADHIFEARTARLAATPKALHLGSGSTQEIGNGQVTNGRRCATGKTACAHPKGTKSLGC